VTSHGSTRPEVDLVLPVHDNLSDTRDCLRALERHTRLDHVAVHLVDDGCDTATARLLREHARDRSGTRLLRNRPAQGFLASCNQAFEAGDAPYVVILNSDVLVTPGWLERLVRCAESDARIAAVNPLTNRAANIDLPPVPGANYLGMDRWVSSSAAPVHPDIVTGVGFCLLLVRQKMPGAPLFDPAYGRGYCEESDLCMRLTTAGHRVVVADDVYLFHRGGGSFTDRDERYPKNRRIFDARWEHEYRKQYKAFLDADALGEIRRRFGVAKRLPGRRALRTRVGRTVRNVKAGRLKDGLRDGLAAAGEVARRRRRSVDAEALRSATRPGALRVTYLLWNLDLTGGCLSVIQLVNELVQLGVEARIATLDDQPGVPGRRLLTEPMVFSHEEELIRELPETDLVVATLWHTAPWVPRILERRPGARGAYFVQDYEAWFYPEEDAATRRAVTETYGLIDNRIVKSDWLAGKLAEHGHESHKIPLGLNLGRFYPRDVEARERPRVVAMARPSTPRRGFATMARALARVKRERPDVELVLFGEEVARGEAGFDGVFLGRIDSPERLAELYSSADLFVDASEFQGFGRPALEAMACGTACVLTCVGGVTEYARPGKNCRDAAPGDHAGLAREILELLDDDDERKRLVRAGRRTAQRFCHRGEAERTLRYFESIIGGQR